MSRRAKRVVKKKVIQKGRLRGCCPMCNSPGANNPQYLVPMPEGTPYRPDNTVWICNRCGKTVKQNPRLWTVFTRCYSWTQYRRFKRIYLKDLIVTFPKKGIPSPIRILSDEFSMDKEFGKFVLKTMINTSGRNYEEISSGVKDYYLGRGSPSALLVGKYICTVQESIDKRTGVTLTL